MPLFEKKSSFEFSAIFSLAIILAFRMLGLFMIYPVFAIDATHLQYASPTLIGMALGIYGLTQGLFQLPLSSLSDYIGRRPVIVAGLLIFGLGGMISACASSIYGVIIGRGLQGAGAIGSTLLAYAADITRIENRTKTMAVLGLTIGASFAIAIVLGPILNNLFHLSGLFWLTALCAFLGIGILLLGTPKINQQSKPSHNKSIVTNVKTLISSTNLFYLNISIFILHAILTSSFIVIPQLLKQFGGVSTNDQWLIYLPVLIVVFLSVFPILHFGEKNNAVKKIILSSIALIMLAQFLWFFSSAEGVIIFALVFFFLGFTVLESILPSLVSKFAPMTLKGTALGIFSTSQFLGIFMGGLIGGMIQNYWGSEIVCLSSGIIALLWLVNMMSMDQPPFFKTEMIRLHNHLDQRQADQLSNNLGKIPGVLEVNISIQHSIAYLKVDNKILIKEKLREVTAEFQNA